ncbi:unnamed protein product [Eruca vesicaria subsp. sativa]|uniref:Uncharacterized protein n=1 Tax=Eruca vesicaria subsp. sativa TaxID=29727 RepID=A0ABC8KCS4_ERUVS|nr:unnamed protein product [Eruca vesicaria subsp. sativa]
MGTILHPDWTELTRDCLIDIFSRLSMGKRWNGPMLVCKKWMNVCQDTSLNTVLDLEAEFLSSTDTTTYWWSPEFEEKVDSTIRSAVDQSQGELKEIRVRHCTNQSLSYVAERCPNLEVLWVKYSPKVNIESMRKISLNCTKLKELDISCSYEISCECMELVGTNCKNLQVLKRNLMQPSEVTRLRRYAYVIQQYLSFETLGNVDAYTIGRHMRKLKHLELRYSTLTDKALAHLCKRCSNLEYMDLVGSMYLTSVGVSTATSSLKNLKEIKKPDFTANLVY